MSFSRESQSTNSANEIISLEELAFVAATLFFIGSIISFYIAYKNLKDSSSTGQSILELVP